MAHTSHTCEVKKPTCRLTTYMGVNVFAISIYKKVVICWLCTNSDLKWPQWTFSSDIIDMAL